MSHLSMPPLVPPEQENTWTLRPNDLLSRPKGLESSSHWDGDYLKVLHVAYVYAAIERVVPQEFVPTSNAVRDQYKPYFTLNVDQVRNRRNLVTTDLQVKATDESKAKAFYRTLEAVLTRGSDQSLNSVGTGTSEESDLSHTTEEDKAETASEILLKLFVGELTDYTFESASDSLTWELRLDPKNGKLTILGQPPISVLNGGWCSLKKLNEKGNWRKVSDLIGFFFEAKRQLHNKSEEELFGQLSAESMFMAKLNAAGRAGDQEVFGFGIHHRNAQIVNVFIPKQYLQAIQTPAGPADNQHIIIKQSQPYDLSDPDQRLQYARQVLGIMAYIQSGTSYVGKMRMQSADE